MSAKRRRAFSVMERLRGLDIDQIKRDMAELRTEVIALRKSREDLQDRLKRERMVTSMEARPYVAAFTDAISKEMRRIESKMHELEPKLIKYENQLRDHFREQKMYETLRLKDLRDERETRARKEQEEIEELTILRWNR
ncbi:hypothetical protein [Pseudooceanicola sp. MF1-13]|uniref:hypothetical protein n=1 Tax=Pseudooceanicola sp. MF1-13 TaxID=3379095 RepID=UPI0038928896